MLNIVLTILFVAFVMVKLIPKLHYEYQEHGLELVYERQSRFPNL